MAGWLTLRNSGYMEVMSIEIHEQIRRSRLNGVIALFAALTLLMPAPAAAAPPELRIIAETELEFGTFAVIGSGYRIVGPDGSVQSSGLFSMSNSDTSPARFTIRYDRGNNGRRPLNLRLQLTLSPAPTVMQGGLAAQLSNYRTDIPGAANVSPGQIIEVTIPNCRTRICSTSFNVGGRLDVQSNSGGGRIAIPIPADVVLISVR